MAKGNEDLEKTLAMLGTVARLSSRYRNRIDHEWALIAQADRATMLRYSEVSKAMEDVLRSANENFLDGKGQVVTSIRGATSNPLGVVYFLSFEGETVKPRVIEEPGLKGQIFPGPYYVAISIVDRGEGKPLRDRVTGHFSAEDNASDVYIGESRHLDMLRLHQILTRVGPRLQELART